MASQGILEGLREFIHKRGVFAVLVVRPENQWYLTGFRALLYSRPVLCVAGLARTCLIVPGLEEAHAREGANVDDLLVYYEHPKEGGSFSHLPLLQEAIHLVGGKQRLGVEYDALSHRQAQELADMGFVLEDISAWFSEARMVKNEEELRLIREAAKLACLGVSVTLEGTAPGRTELEVEHAGSCAILGEAARLHPGMTLDLFAMTQAGRERTLIPHIFSGTRPMEPGDGVIHSRQVGLASYRAECERTAFIGRPAPEQVRLFNLVCEAQRAALNTVRAGVRAREVDRAARVVIEESGLGDYFIHRTGHGIGLSTHEGPYIRFDSEQKLAPNMVICIEPAVYVPGMGGFRHSDTVVVTATGFEMLTEYPRNLDSLTLAK